MAEAQPASSGDLTGRVEDWVTAWVDELTDALLARGEAALTTPRGSIHAWLRRPGRMRRGELRIQATGTEGGASSSGSLPGGRGDDELRSELTFYLTHAVIDLAVG